MKRSSSDIKRLIRAQEAMAAMARVEHAATAGALDAKSGEIASLERWAAEPDARTLPLLDFYVERARSLNAEKAALARREQTARERLAGETHRCRRGALRAAGRGAPFKVGDGAVDGVRDAAQDAMSVLRTAQLVGRDRQRRRGAVADEHTAVRGKDASAHGRDDGGPRRHRIGGRAVRPSVDELQLGQASDEHDRGDERQDEVDREVDEPRGGGADEPDVARLVRHGPHAGQRASPFWTAGCRWGSLGRRPGPIAQTVRALP